MATKFITPSWRMPKNSNQSKASNYSLDFDGSNTKITFDPITLSTNCTLSAWAKRGSTANMFLLGNTGTYGYGVYFNGTSNLYIKGTGAGVTTFNNTAIQTALARTDWVHWLYIKDTTAGTTSVYVDGNLAQSVSTTNAINEINSIGGSGLASGTQYIWNGSISQVSIFDYALSTGSISALYNNGIPSNPLAVATPPIAYYNLGQGSAYASGSAGIIEPNLAAATGSTVFEFDGSDLVVASTDLSSELNQISGSISISCWAKTTQTTVYKYLLVRSRLGGPTKDQGWSFTKDNFYGSGGRMIFGLTNTNGDTMQVRLTGTNDPQGNPLITMNDGKWHHLAATYNRSTSTINLYTDGVLQGTTTTSGFGDYPIPTFGNMEAGSGGSRTCIGGWNNGSTMSSLVASWIGEVSNTQIWDESLTTAEVSTLYNNGTPLQSNIPQSGSLKAWYKLGLDSSAYEDSNWVTSDVSVDWKKSLNLFDKNHVDIRSMSSMFGVFDDVTYSCWIRTSADGQYGKYQIPFGGYSNAGEGFSPNKLWTPYGTTNLTFPVAGATKLNDGVWHHIATTFNDSTGAVKYYVDGQLDVSTTFPGYITHFAIEIGYAGGSSDYSSLKGQVSNCVLHSSELTQPQIETLYNNGVPQLSPSFSPYGWWKCDNITTGIEDSIGSNNGTNAGAIQSNIAVSPNNGLSSGMDTTNLVPSNLIKSIPYSGYSMLFDLADDDSVNCGTDTSLNILSDLSISIWFKTTSSGLHTLINRDQGSGTRIWNISISEQVGQPYIAATFRGDVNKTVSDQVNVNDGNWHNVIAVYDPSTFVKLYVDGILEGTDSSGIPSSLTDDSSVPLYIGAYSNFGSENFDGHLSNASIFNRILTEDEILRVYNGGSPGDLSNLNPTSWWSLGADSYFNGSNWICPDIGANTNNGTSANMGAANLVGDGPDSLANGTSTNLDLASDLIGEAPGSTGNAISINMNSLARTGSTP